MTRVFSELVYIHSLIRFFTLDLHFKTTMALNCSYQESIIYRCVYQIKIKIYVQIIKFFHIILKVFLLAELRRIN